MCTVGYVSDLVRCPNADESTCTDLQSLCVRVCDLTLVVDSACRTDNVIKEL